MGFIYYKAKRFFPTEKYEEKSRIVGRKEIVSYDSMLCSVICDQDTTGDAEFVGEVFDWKSLLQVPIEREEQIIAYWKNPAKSKEHHELDVGFEFCGYDLSEEMTQISALTNCGGMFEKVISYSDLNKFGLIDEYEKAFFVRELLDKVYPNESHAGCEVYELWRRLSDFEQPL